MAKKKRNNKKKTVKVIKESSPIDKIIFLENEVIELRKEKLLLGVSKEDKLKSIDLSLEIDKKKLDIKAIKDNEALLLKQAKEEAKAKSKADKEEAKKKEREEKEEAKLRAKADKEEAGNKALEEFKENTLNSIEVTKDLFDDEFKDKLSKFNHVEYLDNFKLEFNKIFEDIDDVSSKVLVRCVKKLMCTYKEDMYYFNLRSSEISKIIKQNKKLIKVMGQTEVIYSITGLDKEQQERLHIITSHLARGLITAINSKMFGLILKVYRFQYSERSKYLFYDVLMNMKEECDSHKAVIIYKEKLKYYFNIDFENIFSSDDKKTFSVNEVIDYLIYEEKLEPIWDLGYMPVKETELFEFEDKRFLNTFVEGEYEKLINNKPKWDKWFDNDNKAILENFAYRCPLVIDLIKHIAGDERVFYKHTIKLLSDSKYISIANNELKAIKNTLKSPLLSSNVSFNKLIGFCETKLNQLKEEKNYSLNKYKEFLYVLKWLAFIFQNPTIKLPNGLAFKTTQGAGKDITINWVLENIFGGQNVKSLAQTDLAEKFSGYMKSSRFIIANELQYKKEHSSMYENLKRLMTNPKISIRELHKTQINIPNFAHFIFFGNNDNLLKVEKTDRRFSVFEQNLIVPKLIPHLLSPDLKDTKGDLLNPETLHKELLAFTELLHNLKVTYSDVERPIETKIKTEIQDYHKSDVEIFVIKLKDFKSLKEAHAYYEKESIGGKLSYIWNKFKIDEIGESNFIPNDYIFQLYRTIVATEGIEFKRQADSFQKALIKENGVINSSKLLSKNGFKYRGKIIVSLFGGDEE